MYVDSFVIKKHGILDLLTLKFQLIQIFLNRHISEI